MFTSLEVRPVTNGFLVTVNNNEEVSEFVFDSLRKTVRFIKDLSETAEAENIVKASGVK